jgi:hypothetical protein
MTKMACVTESGNDQQPDDDSTAPTTVTATVSAPVQHNDDAVEM